MDFKNKLQSEIIILINLGYFKKIYGKLGHKTKVNQRNQPKNNTFNWLKRSLKSTQILNKWIKFPKNSWNFQTKSNLNSFCNHFHNVLIRKNFKTFIKNKPISLFILKISFLLVTILKARSQLNKLTKTIIF